MSNVEVDRDERLVKFYTYSIQQFKKIRIAKHLSLAVVAKVLSCTEEQLVAWEEGKELITGRKIEKLCDYFRIPPRILILGYKAEWNNVGRIEPEAISELERNLLGDAPKDQEFIEFLRGTPLDVIADRNGLARSELNERAIEGNWEEWRKRVYVKFFGNPMEESGVVAGEVTPVRVRKNYYQTYIQDLDEMVTRATKATRSLIRTIGTLTDTAPPDDRKECVAEVHKLAQSLKSVTDTLKTLTQMRTDSLENESRVALANLLKQEYVLRAQIQDACRKNLKQSEIAEIPNI